MIIPYKDFYSFYIKLNNQDKNNLFYWSLMDTSSWEELPEYYPDNGEGTAIIRKIFRKDKKFDNLIKKKKNFVREFVDQEFLSNYILASEIQIQTANKWFPDHHNIEHQVFPDALIKNSYKTEVNIEIKRILSTKDLVNRIELEVLPNLIADSHKYFILILLFPSCPNDNEERIADLIDGYYVYEKQLGGDNRKVFCQLISPSLIKTKNGQQKKMPTYNLSRLSNRIILNYFKKLDLL